MLYLSLAAILIGGCAIKTSANKLVVTSISDNIQKDVTLDAVQVTPTTAGRVGWTITYGIMKDKFPNVDFKKGLSEQLKVTLDGRPLNQLTITVNMGSREIPVKVPGDVVATYKDYPYTFGVYYCPDGRIGWNDIYFEADEKQKQ